MSLNAYKKSALAYCANVHPCCDTEQLIENLSEFTVKIRNSREVQSMEAGLWLSDDVVSEILADNSLFERFVSQLESSHVHLTSLNGFPQVNFHQEVVKDKVYRPNWADVRRVDYSVRLARLLARVMPKTKSLGVISTVPLGYSSDWSPSEETKAFKNIFSLVDQLLEIKRETGKSISFAFEMEPDCVLENTNQLINFFSRLFICASDFGYQLEDVKTHISVCFDTCHQAVMNEDISSVLSRIEEAGIRISKIQVSNAVSLHVTNGNDVFELCSMFAEEKFLHQTLVVFPSGQSELLPDLNEQALLHLLSTSPNGYTCYVHFHVPIFLQKISERILTTQTAIIDTLKFLQTSKSKPVIEIETYTWLNYLQTQLSDNDALIRGICDEFSWLESQMSALSLIE